MSSIVSVPYSGDGSTRTFDVPFAYLRPRYVRVTVNGVDAPFTWVNATRIELTAAPGAGASVRVFRETPSVPLHDLKDNVPTPALRYKELTEQALHYAEERQATPSELQGFRDEAIAAREETFIALGEANSAAASARASADAAGLYGVPEVATTAELSTVLAASLNVGESIRVTSTGAVYTRVATGGDLNFTASGGVRFSVVRTANVTDEVYGDDLTQLAKSGGGEVTRDASIAGVWETGSDLRLDFRPGVKIRQTKKSVVGAFFTNVVLGADAARRQKNIFINGGIFDGEDYPAIEEYPVQLVTENTFRLPASASSVANFYKGWMIQLMSGGSSGNWWSRVVDTYDGTTRTGTFLTALAPAAVPPVGSVIRLGFNDNAVGFAWGAEMIRLRDGVSSHFEMDKMSPPVLGAKGVNFEQGVNDAVISGWSFEDCGTGLYINAHLGDHRDNGYPKWTKAIRADNLHFERCGSAISLGILDGGAGIPSDPSRLQTTIGNFTFHNCGHAPYRIVGEDATHSKTGIINLMGACGVLLHDGNGYNDATYIADAGGYPTDYPARFGYGQTGPVGAVIWGHARNSMFRNLHYHGAADAAVHIGRARGMGDDAPPNGVVTQLFSWNIDGLYVYGPVAKIVSRDLVTGFNANQITGHWKIGVDSAAQLLDPGLATGTNWVLELTENLTGKTVIGTATQILARGNTFADYPAGVTDLRGTNARVITLADDEAVRIVPPKNRGLLKVMPSGTAGGATGDTFAISYHTFGAAVCEALYGAPVVGTAILTTGTTTGTDSQWNVAAVVSDALYLKNRKGNSRTVEIRFE